MSSLKCRTSSSKSTDQKSDDEKVSMFIDRRGGLSYGLNPGGVAPDESPTFIIPPSPTSVEPTGQAVTGDARTYIWPHFSHRCGKLCFRFESKVLSSVVQFVM